jgi:hypothetical protein
MANIRWKDKDDITTLAADDVLPVTDTSDTSTDKYTTPAEISTYVQSDITIPVKATGAEIDTGTDDAKFATPKAIADSSLAVNPMTTAGDVVYGGASGAETRLAIGTANQVLAVNAGATAPEWVDASSGGGSNSILGVPIELTRGIATTGLVYQYTASEGVTIAQVNIESSIAVTGSSLLVDVRNGGTATTDSIFTSDTEVAITATNSTGESTAIDNGTVAAGDTIYIYITQVGSTIAGSDIKITLL